MINKYTSTNISNCSVIGDIVFVTISNNARSCLERHRKKISISFRKNILWDSCVQRADMVYDVFSVFVILYNLIYVCYKLMTDMDIQQKFSEDQLVFLCLLWKDEAVEENLREVGLAQVSSCLHELHGQNLDPRDRPKNRKGLTRCM